MSNVAQDYTPHVPKDRERLSQEKTYRAIGLAMMDDVCVRSWTGGWQKSEFGTEYDRREIQTHFDRYVQSLGKIPEVDGVPEVRLVHRLEKRVESTWARTFSRTVSTYTPGL